MKEGRCCALRREEWCPILEGWCPIPEGRCHILEGWCPIPEGRCPILRREGWDRTLGGKTWKQLLRREGGGCQGLSQRSQGDSVGVVQSLTVATKGRGPLTQAILSTEQRHVAARCGTAHASLITVAGLLWHVGPTRNVEHLNVAACPWDGQLIVAISWATGPSPTTPPLL